MAFGANLAGAFNIGNQIGQANAPSMVGPQNIMDMFNLQNRMQAMYGMNRALQESGQQLETQYEPQRKAAELQTEYGLKRQYTTNLLQQLGMNGGASSTASPGVSPLPGGSGQVDTNGSNAIQNSAKNAFMVKSFDPMTGQLTMGNTAYDAAQKQAETGPEVIQKQLGDSSQEASRSVAMMRNLDTIRGLYEKAMQNQNQAQPGNVGSQFMQAAKLKLGSITQSNPDWKNYQDALTNFSVLADRGEFGEKGRVVNQLVQQGKPLWPDEFATKDTAQGKWKLLYDIPKNAIDYHNSLVDQHPEVGQNMKVQADSPYLQADQLRQEAKEAIAKGAPGKEVASRFKAKTGMDL